MPLDSTHPSLNGRVARAQNLARSAWMLLLREPLCVEVVALQIEPLRSRTTGVQHLVEAWRQAHASDDAAALGPACEDLARSLARELGGGAQLARAAQRGRRRLDPALQRELEAYRREFARIKHSISAAFEGSLQARVHATVDSADEDDAMQVASEALLIAIDYFSAAHGANFRLYALRRVDRALRAAFALRSPGKLEAGRCEDLDEGCPWGKLLDLERTAGVDHVLARVSWAVSALPAMQAHALRRRYGLGEPAVDSVSELCEELAMHRRQAVQLLEDAQNKVARLLTAAGVLEFEHEARAYAPTAGAMDFPRRAFQHST